MQTALSQNWHNTRTNMEALFENYFIPFQGDIVQILLNLFAYYLCKGAWK